MLNPEILNLRVDWYGGIVSEEQNQTNSIGENWWCNITRKIY